MDPTGHFKWQPHTREMRGWGRQEEQNREHGGRLSLFGIIGSTWANTAVLAQWSSQTKSIPTVGKKRLSLPAFSFIALNKQTKKRTGHLLNWWTSLAITFYFETVWDLKVFFFKSHAWHLSSVWKYALKKWELQNSVKQCCLSNPVIWWVQWGHIKHVDPWTAAPSQNAAKL